MKRHVLTALAAASLAAAPALAAAQTAGAPDPVPAAEKVEGSELHQRALLFPLLVLLAIIAAVLALSGGDDPAETP